MIWFSVWLPAYATTRFSDLSWGNRGGRQVDLSSDALKIARDGKMVATFLIVCNMAVASTVILLMQFYCNAFPIFILAYTLILSFSFGISFVDYIYRFLLLFIVHCSSFGNSLVQYFCWVLSCHHCCKPTIDDTETQEDSDTHGSSDEYSKLPAVLNQDYDVSAILSDLRRDHTIAHRIYSDAPIPSTACVTAFARSKQGCSARRAPTNVLSPPCTEESNEEKSKEGNNNVLQKNAKKTTKGWYSAPATKIKGMARKAKITMGMADKDKSKSSEATDVAEAGQSNAKTTETPEIRSAKVDSSTNSNKNRKTVGTQSSNYQSFDNGVTDAKSGATETSNYPPRQLPFSDAVPSNLILNKDGEEDASMLTSLQSSARGWKRNIFSDAPTINTADIANAAVWDQIAAASLIVERAIKKIEPSVVSQSSPRSLSPSTIGPEVEKALLTLKKHAERLGVKESDLLLAVHIEDDSTEEQEDGTMDETNTMDDDCSGNALTMKEEILEVFKMVLKEK
jgi:hypothetical protein